MIMNKFLNKLWLKMVGVVVLVSVAIVLIIVVWPANGSHKTETGISEKEKRAKIIQAYRDKNRRLPVQAKPLTEKKNSKRVSEETANNFLMKDTKRVNLAEILAARNTTTDDKSKKPDFVLSNAEIKQLLAEKMGEDILEIQSNDERTKRSSKESADNLTERLSKLSQTRQTSRWSRYLKYWQMNRQNRQSRKSGLFLGDARRTSSTPAQNSKNKDKQYIVVSPTKPVEIKLLKTADGEVKAVPIEEKMKNIKVIDPNKLKVYKQKESQK